MQSAVLDLPPGPSGIAAARRWATALCAEWGRTDAADVVALLVSELVTNAVVHAGRPVRLHARAPDGVVRIEVCDPDPREPRVTTADPLAEHGRGMFLLEELATSWGVDPLPPGPDGDGDGSFGGDADAPGKVVWFEVDQA